MFILPQAFDDVLREEGVKAENKRQIYKYSSESDVATARMDDLKRRIKLSEKHVGYAFNVYNLF